MLLTLKDSVNAGVEHKKRLPSVAAGIQCDCTSTKGLL